MQRKISGQIKKSQTNHYSIQSDKKESSPPPQEAQPPPIAEAEVVPTSLPADHEHKEEEPAKPEGELTPTFVEPVKTPEPEQEVIEEEEEKEEEEEAEIVDGGEKEAKI